MKTDPARQPEQQHADLTLLAPRSMKPNSTIHSAQKRLRRMRRLFNNSESSRGGLQRGSTQPEGRPMSPDVSAEKNVAEAAPRPGSEPPPNPAVLIERMEPPLVAPGTSSAAGELRPEFESTVLLLSHEGKIMDAHPSCSVLLGWQAGELIGKSMGEVFDKGVDLLLEPFLKSPEADETGEGSLKEAVQVIAVRKDAGTFPAEITLRRRAALNAWSVVLRSRNPAGPEPEPRVLAEWPAVPFEEKRQILSATEPSTDALVQPAACRPVESETAQPAAPPAPDKTSSANAAELDFMRAQLESACSELQRSLEGISQANGVVETTPVQAARAEMPLPVPSQPQTAAPPLETASPEPIPNAAETSPESPGRDERSNLETKPEPLAPNPPAPAAEPAPLGLLNNSGSVLEPGAQPQVPAPEPRALPAEPVAPAPAPLPSGVPNDTGPELEPEPKSPVGVPAPQASPAAPGPLAPAPVSPRLLTDEIFAVEPQLAREVEMQELERRLRESVGSLARVTAEFERERGARRRSEQRANDLGAQLRALHQEFGLHLESQKLDQQRLNEIRDGHRKLEESLNEARAALAKETAERELAEEQLRAADDLSARLEANLEAVEEAKRSFKDAEADMEARLAASTRAVAESEARLKKETSERQRLEEALGKAQRELQEHAVRNRLESSKRESTRHVYDLERRGCDADELRSRYAAMENRRESHALLHSLCRQMHPPLAALHRSACQLLQGQLQETDKQEVRALLENILLLQMSLQQAAGTPRPTTVSDRPSEPETKPL